MSPHSTTSPILHPYVRISDPSQRKGGGLERQTTADMAEFCRRFGFRQSKRVWIDDGVSAWRGLNATPNHELGKFIAEANRGLIRPGDCLLVENLDRLSRQDMWAATALVNDLRQLKIHIGRLDRMKLLRYDSTDVGDFFECAIEFGRGNSESNTKSDRNGAAWKRKRKAARESGKTITHRLPAWIREVDGERQAIPKVAAIIKRVFSLTANGYGHSMVVKKFTAENVPPFGKGDHWSRSYIALILNDRRVLGEFQPRKRNGEPDGDPIPAYFPAVVSQSEWDAARGGCAQRKKHHGRQATHVNVFAGLLMNARGGDSYYCATRTDGNKPGRRGGTHRVLINTDAAEGRAPCWSFPFATFEAAILSQLREIDPHEILNGESGPDESLALAGELAGVEGELADAKAFMDAKGFSAAIGERIMDLEAKKRDVSERLAEARQRAAHPLSECWGECMTILDALDSAPDPQDARLRLQSMLRRIVESIQLLVVPRGRDRLAAVQIWFVGGERHRDYIVYHRPPKANASARQPGRCWTASLAAASAGPIDLRRKQDVIKLGPMLAHVNLEVLVAAMAPLPDLNSGDAEA
jgi:DNA invertase Pin-like site-specific DNA recombinase